MNDLTEEKITPDRLLSFIGLPTVSRIVGSIPNYALYCKWETQSRALNVQM